jgi:hypothetical protein
LAKDLKAAGASVWMDKLDIRPGQLWERKVEEALSRSSRMLVVISPASLNSSNVMAEAAFAIDEGKEVIPVIYRDCKIPFRLRPFQYADFRGDYAEALQELLTSLERGATDGSSGETLASEEKHEPGEPNGHLTLLMPNEVAEQAEEQQRKDTEDTRRLEYEEQAQCPVTEVVRGLEEQKLPAATEKVRQDVQRARAEQPRKKAGERAQRQVDEAGRQAPREKARAAEENRVRQEYKANEAAEERPTDRQGGDLRIASEGSRFVAEESTNREQEDDDAAGRVEWQNWEARRRLLVGVVLVGFFFFLAWLLFVGKFGG